MENLRSYDYEEGHDYFQNYISLEYLLEQALFYNTRHLCTSTTQSCFLQDDALLHSDMSWPDLEEGVGHKGEKELKEEVGGDAAAKKSEGSEEAVFFSTQHLCCSTGSAHSCLSQVFWQTLKENIARGILTVTPGEKMHEWRLRGGCEEKPLLTFELVAQYFCLPIKKAAAELNVGLTHLKRRCREVGIPRWPHRKVKSLETLIKNAQELGKSKIEVERLQLKKRLIEERPGHVELDEQTKVLRQACFKEKFKRRRLMAIQG